MYQVSNTFSYLFSLSPRLINTWLPWHVFCQLWSYDSWDVRHFSFLYYWSDPLTPPSIDLCYNLVCRLTITIHHAIHLTPFYHSAFWGTILHNLAGNCRGSDRLLQVVPLFSLRLAYTRTKLVNVPVKSCTACTLSVMHCRKTTNCHQNSNRVPNPTALF